MADQSTQNVAKALLKEIPLANMASFVQNMTGTAAGNGCGGGCGGNCAAAVDQSGLVVDPQQLRAAAADKPGLLREISAQVSEHAQTLRPD